jgi:hypothetical protein
MNALSRPLTRRWVAPSVALAFAVFALPGCQDNKPSATAEDAGVADSGPAKPVIGGKLGAAVAAAESAQAASPSAQGGGDGPPASGIFAPGAADRALPPTTPVKIEVLGEGTEPRLTLTAAPKGDEQKMVVSAGLRLGPQQGMLAIDFALTLKLDKLKEEKGKADADKGGPMRVVATVNSAAPAKELAGQLPKELSDAISKLKGSEIRYQLTPEGAVADLAVQLSKGADASIEAPLQGLGEAISLLSVPVPPKPVGVGGYWLVTDHSQSLGVDLLRYRVFKVEKIEKDRATLSVDIRQYAVKDQMTLSGGPGGPLQIARFDSQGKGSIVWTPGALVAPGSQANQRMLAAFKETGNGPGRGLQTELLARSGESEKSDKTK